MHLAHLMWCLRYDKSLLSIPSTKVRGQNHSKNLEIALASFRGDSKSSDLVESCNRTDIPSDQNPGTKCGHVMSCADVTNL